jgi:thiamine biosynthesis protein ThiI
VLFRSHRSVAGSLSRRQVEISGGSSVLSALGNKGVTVDLENPDVTICVDLVGDRAYAYTKKIQGPGGLPLSSQWKMLAVLDSGLLTLLSAFAMMRRGCLVELFIPISTVAPAYSRERQFDLASKLRKLVTRPHYKQFTINLEELASKPMASSQTVVSKPLVRLAAVRFAEENRKLKGIIFADVGGDVSGDLPRAGVTDLPVFTPLIGLSRSELAEMAKLAGFPEDELYRELESPPQWEPSLSGDLSNLHELKVEELTT